MMDKPNVKVECSNQSFPSETETSPVNCECSPQSSKLGSHVQSNESWRKETKNNVYQNSEDVADPLQYVKEENNEYSPKKRCGDPSQLSYYCDLPYHCASPKCTKDYSLEEHLCNKSNVEKNQENDPSYILQNVDENVCKKSPWCSGTVASYLQLYPPCYRSYYYSYGMAPSPASEPTIAEVPLDLSSAGESIAEKIAMPENLPEDITDVSQTNTEAVERGMLYQLLKNKTSK
ncbi:uncharacterized protein LOC118183441 [Stegodyphus dumicola]|uniref:uncharacterized protein LOC118183441 n=1 Tax=Stegodyphus dumicola TaxID=202533 RepID=UPI0015AE546B|nr:uncharacterized protein LOC118183441 [Stegodyphus dumicola]